MFYDTSMYEFFQCRQEEVKGNDPDVFKGKGTIVFHDKFLAELTCNVSSCIF